MGAALSFLGQKLFASSTLINAKCENISCCTSVAVQPPIVRRTGGFLRKRMTTIYVDSRKRVAGSDSDFEVESLHLQSDARLAVYKIRLADSFLSTDRGRYLYWVDAALGTLNWASLPEGAYTGARLAAWISSNFATATYSETTNSLSVAYDGNRLILNDLELRQQFPDAADYPAAPPASPAKPFNVDHMLGPSFVSGGQRIRPDDGAQRGLPALRPAGQRQQSAGQPGRRHFVQDRAEERSGYHCGDGLGRRALHGPQGPGYPEAHALPPDRPGRQRRPAVGARQLPGRRGQEGGRATPTWSCGRGVIDNMIVFQKPFPGAARTELESQLQRAVKVSAKGKHVKCKMDLERCLFWDPAGNCAPRPAEFARCKGRALVEARHVWLMARQWGVLFEVRHLMLEPLEAPCCPF